MEEWYIDINCDVGEGVGNESQLLPLISSCNIACGGHAGDVETMEKVVRLAQKNNVKIGAHPSYPDKLNFGRQVMSISDENLRQSIVEQLKIFDEVLKGEGGNLHHIKAHGALYNQTAKDKNLATLYLDAVDSYREDAFLYVPFGSIITKLAVERGFNIIYEAFADRNYNIDLSLVSRQLDNALIKEPEHVLKHIIPIIKKGEVVTISNERVKIKADTLCIHGDTPSALQILMYLSEELPHCGIQLK
ncbi:5-oxoprolinase subunit PxpA [Flagellimonas sp. 2504JD4-2]